MTVPRRCTRRRAAQHAAVALLVLVLQACGGSSTDANSAAEPVASGLQPSDAASPAATVGSAPPGTAAPAPIAQTPSERASSTRPAASSRPVASATPVPSASRAVGMGSTGAPRPASLRPTPTPTPTPTRSAERPVSTSSTALSIRDFAFTPQNLSIPLNTTVRATNYDGATHDWTSRAPMFASGDLRTNASYSFTFRTAGRFDFLCTIHPSMTGSVTVN